MKRLVMTENLSHEEWLKYRKQGITGTDAGAITGMNEYVSAFAVYQDKLDTEVHENPDNEAMRQGRDFEDYVAKRFTETTGKKVRRANAVFQNEEHPFMLADFDRLVVGEKAGLECKTVSPYSAEKWKEGGIPLSYQLQCQHYLAVSGYDCWYVAALIYGREFIIRKIERDEDVIQNLIAIEKNFWEENVKKRIPPEPDGSDSYSEMLTKLYQCDKNKSIELFGCEKELERREELGELIEKLEKEKTMIDQSIKQKMGDAAYADTSAYKISWVASSQNRMDTKRLKQEKPEIYQAFLNTLETRRFMVKRKTA